MNWQPAPDISRRIAHLISHLPFNHAKSDRIFCFRSTGSTSRATARIWSLPTIWQQALNTQAAYCLEVISHRFDKLNLDEQERVLIHELLHIPKTFSGALVPHRSRAHGRRTYRHYHDTVEALFQSLLRKSYQ
ncbi:hypothetical protein A2634_04165 [Candidatus Amesbacteria bacterium RIFCSPHIGHO2_01_FULL_48_32]|uniref:Putative phage metallopeptidase domain-containing protein n=1 Tax=Candidatus Amesbacteria bacterium RIFCSPLOWO2_01_FULL_48_25 TaxID=1797259 RepID=A0A1F4ZC74_9BACT|nr:MAG: hypothetical protein A2634_04165 [Candidatus Amesbacteria bacterium RIFCSPHIGHO2_01_FULL_48_32]OGD03902.1 MAG: hypothetical protein A2989_04345 [Candidatus Amesbacteria bacterium RIFCSPLOWO2_01_FULL_48_25]HJZ05873.1 putative metallopeptidase [Patescibacteria group bacterium]